MACRFEYNGKVYDQDELAKALEQMPPHEAHKYIDGIKNLPDAPFKKTWDELALKKAIVHAVKNGYDSVSWTPGEAQAARYDLSKSIDKLQYNPTTKKLLGHKDKNLLIDKEVEADKLADFVGKEAADKLLNNPTNKIESHNNKGTFNHYLTGQDLKVGGQGMKAFYDKMLVDKANALVKKHGGKVSKQNIKVGNAPDDVIEKWAARDPNHPMVKASKAEVWTLPITDKMKQEISSKGFPLFSAGVPVFTPVDGNPFESKK